MHTFHQNAFLVSDTLRINVTATRLHKIYTVKYCKLLVQNSYSWWIFTWSNHFEDNPSETNYEEMCATCWSFSLQTHPNKLDITAFNTVLQN